MQRSVTFVIGAGGAGVDIIDRLYQRRTADENTRDTLGLMAVDSDGEKLDDLPATVPTIHLTSKVGLVSEFAAMYPFLSEDTGIPEDGAGNRRDIGRYKFDNAASPEYENYYEEVKAVLERFFNNRSTSLSTPAEAVTCSVLLVTSFGGGTGSGTFPLLATVLDHVGRRIDDLSLRLFGVGIVPPLNFDPERESPPAEPFTYPNTYGALRNLSSLFDADDENPLRLPIYSTVDPADIDADTDLQEAVVSSGISFELSDFPFDGFLLVNSAQGRDARMPLPDGMGSSVSIVAGAVDAFDNCATGLAGRPDSSLSDETPSFGTLGYAALRVPHEEVRSYCQRKQEREELRARRDRERSRLETLREERTRLASALAEQSDGGAHDSSDWIDRVRQRLECISGNKTDFVFETTESEFVNALDTMSEEYRTSSYLTMLSVLARTLSEGSVQQEVKSELEQVYQEVRKNYDADLDDNDIHQRGDLGDRLGHLEHLLDERMEKCERRLEQAEYGLRDIFPPEHELLTSRRERLEEELEQLQTDTNRISEARTKFESFRTKRSQVEHRLAEARSDIHARLKELETEMANARQRRDEFQDELNACEADLSSYRQSLTEIGGHGPEIVLPLEWETLKTLTLDEFDAEFTSIKAYSDRGLLATEREQLIEYLEQCVDYSHEWPDSITEHDPSKVVAPRRGETYVLYAEANTSLISDLLQSLSVPDDLWSATHPDIGFSDCPFRIDVVSTSRKGRPDSLLGYRWLTEQAEEGVFDSFSTYRDSRRAVAYPEWYGDDIADGFD